MTIKGEPTGASSWVLKTLVVVTIVLVALWASRGGLDSIEVPTPSTTTTLFIPRPTPVPSTTPATNPTTILVGTTLPVGTTVAG